MTIYLKMLLLSLEHDGTMWRRVDDLWWSFSFAWAFLVQLTSHLELFMSILSSRSHSFFLIIMPSFCFLILTFCLTFAPLIVLCLKPWFVSTNDLLLVRAYGLLICCPLPMSECFDCILCFMTLILFLFDP